MPAADGLPPICYVCGQFSGYDYHRCHFDLGICADEQCRGHGFLCDNPFHISTGAQYNYAKRAVENALKIFIQTMMILELTLLLMILNLKNLHQKKEKIMEEIGMEFKYYAANTADTQSLWLYFQDVIEWYNLHRP